MLKKLALTAGSIALMTASAYAADPANTLTLQLSTGGPVKIELKPDLAPKHAERIRELAAEGFYNGLTFHRVIDGFMAQTGDPTGTGTSGSSKPDLPAEFSEYNYGRGTVGMARKSDPNSANSQFFICFNDCSFLNGQYTVVGQVTEGMEFIDKIARGEPPATPDKIVAVTAGDAAAASGANTAEAAPASNSGAAPQAEAQQQQQAASPAESAPSAAPSSAPGNSEPAAGQEETPPAADAQKPAHNQ